MAIRIILRSSIGDSNAVFTGDVNWKTLDIENEELESILKDRNWGWHVAGAEFIPRGGDGR
jgi:hypothetical protein